MKRLIPSLARGISAGGILVGLTFLSPAFAAEDQWYDPTDWFDGNNVESDDTHDGYYDYSYDYDYDSDWSDYNDWGVDDWDSDYYDRDYWDNYDWNDGSQTASTSSGTGSTSGSTDSQSTSRTDASGKNAVVYSYVLFVEPIASPQQKQNKDGQSQSAQTADQTDKHSEIARLSGAIEGLRQMNLQRRSGATGAHTIAKIKLENGKTTVVSLGWSSKLTGVNLQVGDRIEAVGRKGMIDGETVFVANSIRAKGKTIDANPAIRLNRGQASQGQTAQAQNQDKAGGMTGSTSGQANATLQGEVSSISRSSAGQGSSQHTLVDIKLKNGKTSTVDFGPAASLKKIGVEEGDHITVQGRRDTVNGRQVIVADLLKVDGEKVSSVSR